MTITPLNILNHEIVGLAAHVVKSSDPTLVCREGRIIGESKEMVDLETAGRRISLAKEVCTLDITLPDGAVVRVDGHLLRGRPEDRLRKRVSGRW